MMELKDVRAITQFEDFYKANNLSEIDEKINRLKEEMGIEAIIYESYVPPEGLLSCLQQQVLEVWDRNSCRK